MSEIEVQYITGSDGEQLGVFVPIELWRKIASGKQLISGRYTGSLRVGIEALQRESGMTFEEARIEIDPESGLPRFRVPPGSPTITTELVRELEDEW